MKTQVMNRGVSRSISDFRGALVPAFRSVKSFIGAPATAAFASVVTLVAVCLDQDPAAGVAALASVISIAVATAKDQEGGAR